MRPFGCGVVCTRAAPYRYSTQTGPGTLTARVPHPLAVQQTTHDVRRSCRCRAARDRTAHHVRLGDPGSTADWISLLFAGPSIFRPNNSSRAASHCRSTRRSTPLTSWRSRPSSRKRLRENVMGYNAGVDMTWRLNRNIGLGLLVRYSSGTKVFTPDERAAGRSDRRRAARRRRPTPDSLKEISPELRLLFKSFVPKRRHRVRREARWAGISPAHSATATSRPSRRQTPTVARGHPKQQRFGDAAQPHCDRHSDDRSHGRHRADLHEIRDAELSFPLRRAPSGVRISRPLRHGVREHTIKAECGEQRGERGKRRRHHRDEPIHRDIVEHLRGHRLRLADRQPWIRCSPRCAKAHARRSCSEPDVRRC